MVRRSDVDRYARAANTISDQAVNDLNKVLDLVAGLPVEEARDELLAILPDLVDYYGDTLAVVAAEWYEQIREDPSKFSTVLADAYPTEQVQGTVQYAGKFLAAGDEDAARELLAGAMQRWIMYSGRETVARNVALDPSKPRFARVPVGETCAWCDMLASRGWVYHSKETAGINGGYHDRCNCQIVPSWESGEAHLEGYDPDDLYDKYMAARQEIEAEGIRSPSDKEIAVRMQKLFPERYRARPTSSDKELSVFANYKPAKFTNNGDWGRTESLDDIIRKQEWVGKIPTLDNDAFDELARDPGMKLVYRGVQPFEGRSASDLNREFLDEDLPHIGNGVYGAGWYTSDRLWTANQYAGMHGRFSKYLVNEDEPRDAIGASVVEMMLHPDARILKVEDYETVGFQSWAQGQISIQAARRGYDVVELMAPRVGDPQEHYYLVLNRTAVIARELR